MNNHFSAGLIFLAMGIFIALITRRELKEKNLGHSGMRITLRDTPRKYKAERIWRIAGCSFFFIAALIAFWIALNER